MYPECIKVLDFKFLIQAWFCRINIILQSCKGFLFGAYPVLP